MLNYLWAAMIGIGVVWGACTGQMEAVSNGLIEGGTDAVELCITMLGVVGMWCGVMEVAKRAGIVEGLTRRIAPAVSFLFPRIPKGHPAMEAICLNIVANILGLGWAATPAGLKAMEDLAKLECERGNPAYCIPDDAGSAPESYDMTDKAHGKSEKVRRPVRAASNEMCIFLIINISSLQLIPVNMIAYRSQYGSAAPAVIVGPAILATLMSTVAAVVFCKGMDGKRAEGRQV